MHNVPQPGSACCFSHNEPGVAGSGGQPLRPGHRVPPASSGCRPSTGRGPWSPGPGHVCSASANGNFLFPLLLVCPPGEEVTPCSPHFKNRKEDPPLSELGNIHHWGFCCTGDLPVRRQAGRQAACLFTGVVSGTRPGTRFALRWVLLPLGLLAGQSRGTDVHLQALRTHTSTHIFL